MVVSIIFSVFSYRSESVVAGIAIFSWSLGVSVFPLCGRTRFPGSLLGKVFTEIRLQMTMPHRNGPKDYPHNDIFRGTRSQQNFHCRKVPSRRPLDKIRPYPHGVNPMLNVAPHLIFRYHASNISQTCGRPQHCHTRSQLGHRSSMRGMFQPDITVERRLYLRCPLAWVDIALAYDIVPCYWSITSTLYLARCRIPLAKSAPEILNSK